MSEPITLTLYGRGYCHLCHDMEVALESLQREFGFRLDPVDVDEFPEIEERLGELVPVLMAGERELCHYFLDEAAVRAYLSEIR